MNQKINKNWKFYLGDSPDAWAKDYDDSAWRKVVLPHDWAVEGDFSEKNASGTGYLPAGTGWYRGVFFIPEKYKDKKIWIRFDGVYKNSQVWCNSHNLGKRPNGYINFQYDISHCACFGDIPNQISVKVSHEDISDSRWYTGSGITRDVSILVQEKTYFDEYGVFFSSQMLDKNKVRINVRNEIVNEAKENITATIKNELKDVNGKTVALMTENITIAPEEKCCVENTEVLNSPQLWSDQSPYLYTLYTSMIIEGNECNIFQEKVGIRDFSFEPDQGFYINHENKKLKGVCVHHDGGCLGAAVPRKVWKRRLTKLKEMGCNAIRMSHNPHSPDLFDLCDEMGFYVIDEAFDEWEGCKNKWHIGHNVYPPKHQGYAEEFPHWHEIDLRALIRRDRNHPSVLLWSIGNEIDYPNDPYCHPSFDTMTGNNDKNKPAAERVYNPNKPNMERIVWLCEKLVSIVKKEDITRPVTSAVSFPELSAPIGFINPLDVVGYNYKEQFYERDHKLYPDKPFLGSENGHSFEQWKYTADNDYISGQFLWTGIDFLGEARGWPIHGSMAGHLTTAGFEKPDFWFRKSLWSQESVIEIVTSCDAELPFVKKWNYNKGENIIVRCYTNDYFAELFLNGLSLGQKEYNNICGYMEWIVPFEDGVLTAKTNHISGEIQSTDSVSSMRFHIFDNEIYADGEDIAQIEIHLVDEKGLDVDEDDVLSVSIKGEASLLGIENGDLADNTAYSKPFRSTYMGKLIIYIRSTLQSGEVELIVKGNKVGEHRITLQTIVK